MKTKEREKLENIQNRLVVVYEVLEMARNILMFNEVLKPLQVGIVLDGLTKEIRKQLNELSRLNKNG